MPTFEKNTAMNVLITGASRGLGKCIAEHFAAEGANLILCSRSMQQTIGWQQQLITKHGISVSAFDVDMRDVERVKAFAGEILTAGINIDILVNNAGVGTAIATLPVSLPVGLVAVSSYLIAIGTTAATIAQTAEQR